MTNVHYSATNAFRSANNDNNSSTNEHCSRNNAHYSATNSYCSANNYHPQPRLQPLRSRRNSILTPILQAYQLRHFGSAKEMARERFREFVIAGIGLRYPEEFDSPAESGILGSDEFVDDAIHRIGDVAKSHYPKKDVRPFDAEVLIDAVESVFGLAREKFLGRGKSAKAVMAKEIFILIGVEAGATLTQLSGIIDLDTSTTSRRNDAAKEKLTLDNKTAFAKNRVAIEYRAKIAELQD